MESQYVTGCMHISATRNHKGSAAYLQHERIYDIGGEQMSKQEERGNNLAIQHSIRFAFAVCLGVSVSSVSTAVLAQSGATEVENISRFSMNLRARAEHVNDDAFSESALASSLRTRLRFDSASWNQLSAAVELDNVSYLGDDRFNNTRNGQEQYPVVADPKGSDLNQIYAQYKNNGTTLKAGRQRIVHNDQRFIGGVAWRQNEQTFDGITWQQQWGDSVQLQYGWIDDTQRIFGPDEGNPAASLESDHHIVNVNWKVADNIDVTVFSYDLDFEDAAALSSSTLGVDVKGNFAENLSYRLTAADQRDNAGNPLDYSASYWLAAVSAKLNGITLSVTETSLGADEGANRAFQTPLATLHAFQGWADRFLTTPGFGMRDTQLSVSGSWFGVNAQLHWHQYRSDTGSSDLGSEWNMLLTKQIDRYSLALKFADYQADQFSRDTQKIWFTVATGF